MAAGRRAESCATNGRIDRQRGRHRSAKSQRRIAYGWLGAGALTIGVGAALATGSGVAHADTTGPDGASASSTSASERASTSSAGATKSSTKSSLVKSVPGRASATVVSSSSGDVHALASAPLANGKKVAAATKPAGVRVSPLLRAVVPSSAPTPQVPTPVPLEKPEPAVASVQTAATLASAPAEFPYRNPYFESCPSCVASGLTTAAQADAAYRAIVAGAKAADPKGRFYTAGSADYYDRVGSSPGFRWVNAAGNQFDPSFVTYDAAGHTVEYGGSPANPTNNGFTVDSAGKISYHNATSDDVAVSYRNAGSVWLPRTVVVVAPGQSVTLPVAGFANYGDYGADAQAPRATDGTQLYLATVWITDRRDPSGGGSGGSGGGSTPPSGDPLGTALKNAVGLLSNVVDATDKEFAAAFNVSEQVGGLVRKTVGLVGGVLQILDGVNDVSSGQHVLTGSLKIASGLFSEAAGIAITFWFNPQADVLAANLKILSLSVDAVVALLNTFAPRL
jgi:hypothetical protein